MSDAMMSGNKKMTRADVDRLLQQPPGRDITVSDRFSIAIDRLRRLEEQQEVEQNKDCILES